VEYSITPFVLHVLIGLAYLTAAIAPFIEEKNIHFFKRVRNLNKFEIFVGVCYVTLAFSEPAH